MKTTLAKLTGIVMLCLVTSCHKEPQTGLPGAQAPLLLPPAITYPLPNSVNGNCVPIQWQAAEGAAHYTLQIATDSVFAFGSSVILQTTLPANENQHLLNLPNGGYWCRINMAAQTGISPWSAAMAFSVYTTTPENCTGAQLISPQLLLPQANAQLSGTTQTFTWLAVPAALQYRLQISGSQDFSELLYNNASISLTFRTVQNFVPGMYFWRVMATNNIEQSNWSETRLLTILP